MPLAADLQAVIDLEEAAFGKAWSVADYVLQLSRNKWQVLVIGSVKAALWYRQRSTHTEIETICVAPKERSKGLGTRLLRHMMTHSACLRAWVREDNERALALYKRLGFRVLRRKANHFGKCAGVRIEWHA